MSTSWKEWLSPPGPTQGTVKRNPIGWPNVPNSPPPQPTPPNTQAFRNFFKRVYEQYMRYVGTNDDNSRWVKTVFAKGVYDFDKDIVRQLANEVLIDKGHKDLYPFITAKEFDQFIACSEANGGYWV